jgi:hypothetical protein
VPQLTGTRCEASAAATISVHAPKRAVSRVRSFYNLYCIFTFTLNANMLLRTYTDEEQSMACERRTCASVCFVCARVKSGCAVWSPCVRGGQRTVFESTSACEKVE